MNMFGATAKAAQRHGETVTGADLGDAAAEMFDAAIGEIIAVNALDIGQRGIDIERGMARARTGFKLATGEAAARAPIVKQIIGTSEHHTALDDGAHIHGSANPKNMT